MPDRSRETDTATQTSGDERASFCTLTPDRLDDRMAWIRSEILPHAEQCEIVGDGFVLGLRPSPSLMASLDRLIELERGCCSGIEIEHGPGRGTGLHRLEVRGVDPGSPLLDGMRLPAPTRRRLARRLAGAAGVGTATSLLVCCVVPVVVAAAFGGAAVAPIAGLDHPMFILGGALGSGIGVFVWSGRRRSPRAAGASGCSDGC